MESNKAKATKATKATLPADQVCQENPEQMIIHISDTITQSIFITDNILVAPT